MIIRLCIDYKELNKIIIKDKYSLWDSSADLLGLHEHRIPEIFLKKNSISRKKDKHASPLQRREH